MAGVLAVGFVMLGAPEAILASVADPVAVGFVIDGEPEASWTNLALPLAVGFVILGLPLASRVRVVEPLAVGLVIDGLPEAVVCPPLTVTAIQPNSLSDCRSTPSHKLPVFPPAGSLNVMLVPSCVNAVTCIWSAPTVVWVVFR